MFSTHVIEEKSATRPKSYLNINVIIPKEDESIFVVQARAAFNNILLQASEHDIEKMEFSFDWKEIFTYFFTQRLTGKNLNAG